MPSRCSRSRWRAAAVCLGGTAVVAVVAFVTGATHSVEQAVDTPSASATLSLAARRDLLQRRANVTDPIAVATINAELASEAIERGRRVFNAWMARRDEGTGLFPQSSDVREWNYRNTAADFFGYQFSFAWTVNDSRLPLLRKTLARERRLNAAGSLCRPLDPVTGKFLKDELHGGMFATSEYLKDGLVSLYGRTGDSKVLARMVEIADAIVAESRQASKFGLIPSNNSEVNGNVLQAFTRLSFLIGTPAYVDMAGRLADAVIVQMLASSGGLPVMRFDYSAAAGAPVNSTDKPSPVQLRDHGNETAVGLSEAFALAVTRRETAPDWAERADRWVEPIARMYELILSRGVGADGLIMNRLAAGTLTPVHRGACDNWGYLLSGAILFCQAAERHGTLPRERRERILAGVDEVARAVIRTEGLRWEGDHHDGWADTVESAIYVAAHRPSVRRELLAWADDQIGHMFALQKPDGFVSGDYLDGNFIRTALLYADLRTGGFRLDPWSSSVRLGFAAMAEDGSDAVIVIIADANGAGYRGRLIPDTVRHRDRMKLPWDWPQINAWPEWAAADGAATPMTIKLAPGEQRVVTLAEVRAVLRRRP